MCIRDSPLESNFDSFENTKIEEDLQEETEKAKLTIPEPNLDILGGSKEVASPHDNGVNDLSDEFSHISIKDDVVRRNKLMELETKFNKLLKLINIWNLTLDEYYEFMDVINDNSSFLDFDIGKPFANM